MSSVNSKPAWWQRLNRALFPYMGPAQVGPYETEPVAPSGQKPCPLCGSPMDDHTFERSQDRHATRMHCPA